jgi:hypothetical protein
VITAQMALNYAAFLEEHNFFKDSFRVYEQAVALFGFPQVSCGGGDRLTNVQDYHTCSFSVW